MTIAEKWRWHTDVYAFRRVYLGITATTSPVDPNGNWHDPALVEPAERRKRAELEQRKEPGPGDRDAWARSLGWSSWLERQDAIEAEHRRQEHGLAWQREHADELRAMRPLGRVVSGIARRARRTTDQP
jgi:hypothetical protein